MSEEKKSLLRDEENHGEVAEVEAILPKKLKAKALYVPPAIWVLEKANVCKILPKRLR